MTKKHYKIQSQKGYWFETLSLFTDESLTKEEMEEYKHELAQRLADLVKNNCVLDDVINCKNLDEDFEIALNDFAKKTIKTKPSKKF